MAPVRPRPRRRFPTDLPATSSPTADRFNFAPFNFIQIPLERYGGFVNVTQELGDTLNFSCEGALQPAQFGEPGGAVAAVRRPGRRQRQSARHDHRSTRPTRSTRSATLIADDSGTPTANYQLRFIGRRVVENGPRRLRPEGRHLLRRGDPRRPVQLCGHDWYWDVNGLWGRNNAKQTMHGNINARAISPGARTGRRCCTAPCVPFNIFGGAGSITQAMLDYVAFTQHDSSQQKIWDVSAQHQRRPVRPAAAGPLGIAVGVEHRDLTRPLRSRPDRRRRASAPTSRRCRPRGSYNVDGGLCRVRAPCSCRTPGRSTARAHWRRPLFRLFDRFGILAHDLQGRRSTGSRSRRSASRGNWAQGFRAPTSASCSGRRRVSTRRSPTPARPQHAARRFTNDAAVRANCIAHGVPANGSYDAVQRAAAGDHRRQRGFAAGNFEQLGRRRRGQAAAFRGLSLEDELLQHQGQRRDPGDRRQHLLDRCAHTDDPLSCAA